MIVLAAINSRDRQRSLPRRLLSAHSVRSEAMAGYGPAPAVRNTRPDRLHWVVRRPSPEHPAMTRMRRGNWENPTSQACRRDNTYRHEPRKARLGAKAMCLRSSTTKPRSGCRPQHNADRDFAGHDQAPQRNQQFPGECHDHRRLAHALRAFGPRPINLTDVT